MSYIEDFFKNNFLKGLIPIAFLMCFWYLSIYLLNKEFYVQVDFSLLLILSFVLSSSSFILGFLLMRFIDNDDTNIFDKQLEGSFTTSTMVLWLWKVVWFLIAYSIIFFFDEKLYYYWYVVVYFSVLVLLVIIFGVHDGDDKKENNKN